MFNDEPFIISLAQRLYLGNSLIFDEWHGTQNTGILLYPFYAVFLKIKCSTEGILLYFRYVYTVLWISTCVIVCYRLKKFNCRGLILVYLILFSPHDYMTCSYNTFSLMAVLLISAELYYLFSDKRNQYFLHGILIGLLLSAAVLCYPALTLLYVLFTILTVLHKRVATESISEKQIINLWYGITVSVIVCAVTYISFGLLNRSTGELILNIKNILDDPEHIGISFTLYDFVLFSYLIFLMVFSFLKKSESIWAVKTVKVILKNRIWFFAASVFVWFWMDKGIFIENSGKLNFQVDGIALVGIVAYMLLVKKDKVLFNSFYSCALIFYISAKLLSNTGRMATAIAMTVGGSAGIIFIVQFIQELLDDFPERKCLKSIICCLAMFILIFQLGLILSVRLNRQYHDDALFELDTKIETGVAKGLYTTNERKCKYEEECKALNKLLNEYSEDDETFLALESNPWIYLEAGKPYCTFSAWTFGYSDDELLKKLSTYFEMHNGKIPDLIYLSDNSDWLKNEICRGYNIQSENGYILLTKG